jgi:hypothetical protein|tara:strand:- start:361 stop:498 length:138 start_codon:yes stop_codon:yes gene_type:complete
MNDLGPIVCDLTSLLATLISLIVENEVEQESVDGVPVMVAIIHLP